MSMVKTCVMCGCGFEDVSATKTRETCGPACSMALRRATKRRLHVKYHPPKRARRRRPASMATGGAADGRKAVRLELIKAIWALLGEREKEVLK